MPHYDAQSAQVLVYTYKEGVLAAVAHDLKLRFDQFSLTADDAHRRFEADLDARSLHVVCARSHGQDAPATLSESDKKDIEKNVSKSVLHGDKHPRIRVTVSEAVVPGTGRAQVELCGVRKEVPVTFTSEGTQWVARARLHQPDFGIKPYSAMLGALKLRPDVDIEVRVPAAGA